MAQRQMIVIDENEIAKRTMQMWEQFHDGRIVSVSGRIDNKVILTIAGIGFTITVTEDGSDDKEE